MTAPQEPLPSGFDARYTRYQTDRSAVRKLVRKAYLRSARSRLQGAVLDFGCGIGELLETLPPGSAGLEYNRATVEHCRAKGLDVHWYDGFSDGWQLSAIPEGRGFDAMVVSHVLEHLRDPMAVLNALLHAAGRIGIGTVLAIVPGRAGYRSDATHETFVDRAMLEDETAWAGSGFRLDGARYFPGNARWVGDWFPHHELQVVYRRLPG